VGVAGSGVGSDFWGCRDARLSEVEVVCPLRQLVGAAEPRSRRPLLYSGDDGDDLVLDNDLLAHTVSCGDSRMTPWMRRVLSVFGLVIFRS
jgi:hypothetical protein